MIIGCALIAGGALALAWYVHLRADMARVQEMMSRQLDAQKKRMAEALPKRPTPHAVVIPPPHSGDPIGKIEIPRLQMSTVVLEGASAKNLRVAAGHIRGTALPGTGGNVAIAAHRDTFFEPLRGVRPKDAIVLTTSYGTFRYVVDRVEVVDPSNVGVLHRTTDPELTLVTCYPFVYVGSAPKRFIVHARQQIHGEARAS